MLIASRYQLAKDSDPKLMTAHKNRFELLRDSKSQCTFTTRGLMASRGPTPNPGPFPRITYVPGEIWFFLSCSDSLSIFFL